LQSTIFYSGESGLWNPEAFIGGVNTGERREREKGHARFLVVVAVVVMKRALLSFRLLVLFLSFFLQMNGWRFSAVQRNTLVSRRREVISDGWKVGIIERGERGRGKAKGRRQGDGGPN